MNIKLIGIDLAKRVFQLCAVSATNKVIFNRQVSRAKLAETLAQIPPCLVAMEACASAHYWGRRFQAMGHEVRLIPAQHVKAFVRVNKNDANDALAITEAVQRPNLHCVRVKSAEQQDLAVLHRVRQRSVEQRTAIINQLRGLAAEYGVIFPKSRQQLMALLPEALEDGANELTVIARQMLAELGEEIRQLNTRVEQITQRLEQLTVHNDTMVRLRTIPGFGPIVASAFWAAVGDGLQYKNGRALAAATGLVPRQSSSGGKIRLGKITKNGDRYLRYQLINGARALVVRAAQRDDAMGHWVTQLQARSSFNNAVTAMSNKLARIGWHVLTSKQPFDLNKAFDG